MRLVIRTIVVVVILAVTPRTYIVINKLGGICAREKYRLPNTLKVAYSTPSRPAQSVEIASPAVMWVCIPVPSRIPHPAAR